MWDARTRRVLVDGKRGRKKLAPLTAREASPRSFSPIFTSDSPRAQEDWPEITPRPVPEMHESLIPLDAPLGVLGKSLFFSVLTMAEGKGLTVPDLNPNEPIKGGEALTIAREIVGEIFPNMRD